MLCINLLEYWTSMNVTAWTRMYKPRSLNVCQDITSTTIDINKL